MTDNEKAATFIGWKPGMLSIHGYQLKMAEIDPRYHQTLTPVDPDAPMQMGTTIPAPDMTDPKNYMKALEKIEPLEAIFQMYDGLNVCIYRDKYREKNGEKPTAYGFDEHSWGDAVVMALSALYDADHPVDELTKPEV